jgi:hypothetical protein
LLRRQTAPTAVNENEKREEGKKRKRKKKVKKRERKGKKERKKGRKKEKDNSVQPGIRNPRLKKVDRRPHRLGINTWF